MHFESGLIRISPLLSSMLSLGDAYFARKTRADVLLRRRFLSEYDAIVDLRSR